MHIFTENFHHTDKSDRLILRLDARLKIFIAMILLIMNLSYQGVFLPLITTGICLLFIINLQIPFKIFILRFSEPVFIAAMLLILKTFFSSGESHSILHFGGIHIEVYKNGFIEGTRIALRIISSVSVIALLGFATPFTQFVAALAWFKIPGGFLEICLIAYRFIFVLVEEAMTIYQAQKNRLGYSGMLRGLSSFGSLAGALTIKVFDHSQTITLAMTQRGYDGSLPLLKHQRLKVGEILGSFIFIITMGTIWIM